MNDGKFMALVSHELRGPIGAIGAAAHVLKESNAAGADAAQARDVIARQAQRLVVLLQELTELARVRSGNGSACMRADLAELLREIVPKARIEVSEAMVRIDAGLFQDTLLSRCPGSQVTLAAAEGAPVLRIDAIGDVLAGELLRALLESAGAQVEIENGAEGRRLTARLPR